MAQWRTRALLFYRLKRQVTQIIECLSKQERRPFGSISRCTNDLRWRISGYERGHSQKVIIARRIADTEDMRGRSHVIGEKSKSLHYKEIKEERTSKDSPWTGIRGCSVGVCLHGERSAAR